MRKFVFVLGLVLTSCGGHRPPAWDAVAVREKHPWGYYSGQVEARWENDGRDMTLLTELRYIDPDGVVWIAPAGSVVDNISAAGIGTVSPNSYSDGTNKTGAGTGFKVYRLVLASGGGTTALTARVVGTGYTQ